MAHQRSSSKKVHAIEEINVLSGKMDELMKLFATKNTPLDPNDSRGNDTYCIVAIEDRKMGFISYCMSLSLYIMSSCLKRYSVLHGLNPLDAGRSRSMCGVIVEDAGRSRSTCHGRDAYIHDRA